MSLKIILLPIPYVVCLNTIRASVKPRVTSQQLGAHKSFAREIHIALFVCLLHHW